MKKNAMKQKMAAVLCMAMLLGQTAPAAVGEELASRIAPEGRTGTAVRAEQSSSRRRTSETGNEGTQRSRRNPNADRSRSAVTSESAERVEPIAPVEPVQKKEPVYSRIDARVKTGEDSITVMITEASDEPMYVALGEDVKTGLHKGDRAVFSGLAAGEYDVEVDYENGTNAFRTSATIKAASSGGAELITPPSSGNAELITPPSSGSEAVPIIPPSSGSSAQEVKAFTIRPVAHRAQVSVEIHGASNREIEIKLLDERGKEVASSSIIGSGTVKLGEFADGSYTVRAQYVTPVQNGDGSFDFKTVTGKVTVRRGLDEQPEQEKPIDIQAKIEKGKDYIIITVTQANDREMLVSVEGLADKKISKGASVRYEGLTPGESYHVEIDYADYIEGAKKFEQTVTLDKPEMLGRIQITAVTPGTNKLTVSGKAAPGQQVILTTKPAAAADVYAMADARGIFKAEIACAAGVYTAVTAKYSADTRNRDTASGNWVVSASSAKPTLTVDPIDTASTTVIAKTAAGVIVEIKTGDYTQKATADENGIVRFSLPHTYAKNTEFTFIVHYGHRKFFTQTVRVSGAEYLGTLEYGDEGDAVRKLTRRLAALGYPVEETGRYGSTVREAVRLFQRANGLDDDGIAGPKTQQALFSVGAIAYGAGKYPTLVRGDRDYALVYTLQQRLKDLGYYTIKVDGIFGSGTQRAVREFQRVNGLSVTGKADNATQQLLYSSAAKPAGSSSGIPSDYQTLSRSGKYKSAVVPLQKRLRELGYYSGNIDGYFGSQTYRAVRNFQSRNGLTVTGVADAYTQQILYSAAAKTYSGSTASSGSVSSGYRLLYWGCRGDAVKRLQNALIAAGYKSLVREADGIFGQWTYDAVCAYQKDHGLAVDGIAGKNTQNLLYGTKY